MKLIDENPYKMFQINNFNLKHYLKDAYISSLKFASTNIGSIFVDFIDNNKVWINFEIDCTRSTSLNSDEIKTQIHLEHPKLKSNNEIIWNLKNNS